MFIQTVIYLVCCVTLICLSALIGYSLWTLVQIATKNWRELAFKYVYINDDGSARELNAEEEEKLSSLLFVGDDDDFYIKSRYESLNPHGGINGYL